MSQRSNSNKGHGCNQSETARSRSNRSSDTASSSKISMAVAMAKAKAEAAQARAAHSQREIELKVEQARIQAKLDALNSEKERDAAIAEANTLAAGLQDMGFGVRSEVNSLVPQSIKDQRTAAFVTEQASLNSKRFSVERESDKVSLMFHSPHPQPTSAIPSISNPYDTSQAQAAASDVAAPHHTLQASQASAAPPPQSFHQPPYSSLAPQLSRPRLQQTFKQDSTSPAHPSAHRTHYGVSRDNSATSGDLIRYLARNHLVTSGLTTYDDQPMNYWAWKTSFQNAIAELDMSAAEEFDLLIKYLGRESAEQVRRIKTVNIKNPAAGLCMAWERLDEIYGSPEAVER